MTSSGLITLTVIGRQKHYQANKDCPIFNELRAITLKTFGMADVLRMALSPHLDTIQCAFVYGSVAKRADTAASDIDVMVVADGLTYSDLYEALAKAEETLGRKVSPTLYTVEDFQRKAANENHFVIRVLGQPSIPLIGDKHAISKPSPVESGADWKTQGGTTGST